MEGGITTSFIPKKTMGGVKKSSSGGGFIIFVSTIILVAALLGWGGAYAYISYLDGQVVELRNQVVLAEKAFNSAALKEFEDVDRRITMAEKLLESHIAPGEFLRELDRLTLETVRYDSIDFSLIDDQLSVELTGQATDFASVALQAKAFSEDGRFISPIFSDLDTEDLGNVVFTANMILGPSLVRYVPGAPSANTEIIDPEELEPNPNTN